MGTVSVHVPFYRDTPENKAVRLAMVVDGWPDEPLPERPRVTEHIDVLVRSRESYEHDGLLRCHHVQIWLLANEYTLAKRDWLAETFTYKHLSGLSELSYVDAMTKQYVISAVRGR